MMGTSQSRITAVLGGRRTPARRITRSNACWGGTARALSACRCGCLHARSMTASLPSVGRMWSPWSPARNASCPSAPSIGSAPSRRCPRAWARISWRSMKSSFAPIRNAAMSLPTGCCAPVAPMRRCSWARIRCAVLLRRWYRRRNLPDASGSLNSRMAGRKRSAACPRGRPLSGSRSKTSMPSRN